MSIEFTESGLAVQPLAEITEELAEGYRSIYGQDINVEPESPDGQRIGIEAKARADMQAFALMLYNQQDPDFATGQVLRSKMKYAGITIRPATRSQALRSPTQWHRTEAQDCLRHGAAAMHQHAEEARELEALANQLDPQEQPA